MLQEGLHALLAGDAGIQRFVGTSAGRTDGTDGIFPVSMPKDAPLPVLVYARIAGHEMDTLDGRGDLRIARVQISSYAADTTTMTGYASVAGLHEAAKTALIGFHGVLTDEDATQVDRVSLLLEHDLYEAAPRIYHSLFDVEIFFRNSS